MPDLFSPKKSPTQQSSQEHASDAFVPTGDTIPKPDIPPSPAKWFHPFSSFCQNPVGVHFANQEETETILLLLRAHFVTNVPWIFLTILFALIPGFLNMFLTAFPQNANAFTLSSSYTTVLLCFYYLILFAYAFMSFLCSSL